MDNKNNNNEKKYKKIIPILIVVFILIFTAVVLVIQLNSNHNITPPDASSASTAATQEAEQVSNPIDFKPLKEKNNDIYAWIKIDDTKVDYPIVQSRTDDAFYLRHKAEDKSWSASGAVYTELGNTKSFADPVTVIYGHNGYNDSMFTTLHYFEKKEFFDSHPYFYIYTPEKRLTYQVVSAFKYDDRHILNSFDLANALELRELHNTIQNPDSALKNVRTDLDAQLDINSKVVILSTCITNQKSSRYLVCGVLVKNEKTY